MEKHPIQLQYSRSNQVEDLMTQWRIHWEYIEAYPLANIAYVNGQQVREQAHIAPKDVVESYAHQAANGAKFPPIVLARDVNGHHTLIDGNTRKAMAESLDQETFPVYVAHVSSKDYAKSLGAALNNIGGRRLSEAEAMAAALVMLGENVNFNDGEIAQAVGVTTTRVAAWRKDQEATQRAERLGVVEQLAEMPLAQRKQMVRITQDEPFKAVAELAGTRRIINDDFRSLIGDVINAPSEDDALERIRELADTVPAGGPTGQAPVGNQKARRMRMLLPQIINLWPPADLYEPDRASEDFKAWLRVKDTVDGMLAMYADHGFRADSEGHAG